MTRKRRCLIVAGILAGCVAVVLGVLAMLPPQPGITKANLDRIKNGVPRQEVEVILGESGEIDVLWLIANMESAQGKNSLAYHWSSNDRGPEVRVIFTDGIVTRKAWLAQPETMAAKLRRWLRFQ